MRHLLLSLLILTACDGPEDFDASSQESDLSDTGSTPEDSEDDCTDGEDNDGDGDIDCDDDDCAEDTGC